jgi:glutathione synthase
MRFLYVMDPMDRLLVDKDTTFAFQRAAQARGHVSLHTMAHDLYVDEGALHARCRAVTVSDTPPHAVFGDFEDLALRDIDAVLIRKDPPFNADYLYATLMLERARHETVIVNDPRGLRDANEKLYALNFAEHMPRTMVASNAERLLAFADRMGGTAVVKPLDGAGGSGVMLLSRSDKNARAILELLTSEGRHEVMAQEYLPAVREGDKRVILLDGEILGGILRVPRADDLRSNIHVGGTVVPTEVTPAEQAVVKAMAPRLKQDGLFFVGLDFIGGKLTEVNVTSPTGIQELSRHRGEDMSARVIAWLEKRVLSG